MARHRRLPIAMLSDPSPFFLTHQDIVTRYASTTGHHVIRRFGWDCHGLPVEFEIDKKLGIKTRDDVLKMGIAAYNEECRSIVMRYSKEWEKTVHRLGEIIKPLRSKEERRRHPSKQSSPHSQPHPISPTILDPISKPYPPSYSLTRPVD